MSTTSYFNDDGEVLPTMSKFVFISYKSEDRDLIRPYLDLLKENGIDYWWDQEIAQDWDKEIERRLNECSAVVGFMTESSWKSSAVYAEFDIGNSCGKLFPVRLDPSPPSYRFRTVLGSLSFVDFSSESQDRIEQEKKKLISKLSAVLEAGVGSVIAEAEPDGADMERWFSAKERQAQIAYIVALCFFEGHSHDFIQDCAAKLEQELIGCGLDEMLALNSKLITRTNKLKSIGAQVRTYHSKVTGSALDSVVFDDSRFGERAFLYVWNELDQLKYPIVMWMNRLLDTLPANCVGDIAVMLSLIGRQNFQSIYRLILKPWLNQAWSWPFLCADITLSLLMDDTGVKNFIENELLQVGMDTADSTEASTPDEPVEKADEEKADGSGSGSEASKASEFSQSLPRASAIALVTGYAGMRMPDLSVALFKQIDGEFEKEMASRKGLTLHCIDRGIDNLLMRVKTDPYAQSLPITFASRIHGWMSEEGGVRNTVLPEYIFLRLLEKLTILDGPAHGAPKVVIQNIIADGDAPDARAIDTFGRAIGRALECRNTFIRDAYTTWIKTWKKRIKEPVKDGDIASNRDMEKRIFAEIFDVAKRYASSANDIERIEHHTKLS